MSVDVIMVMMTLVDVIMVLWKAERKIMMVAMKSAQMAAVK